MTVYNPIYIYIFSIGCIYNLTTTHSLKSESSLICVTYAFQLIIVNYSLNLNFFSLDYSFFFLICRVLNFKKILLQLEKNAFFFELLNNKLDFTLTIVLQHINENERHICSNIQKFSKKEASQLCFLLRKCLFCIYSKRRKWFHLMK